MFVLYLQKWAWGICRLGGVLLGVLLVIERSLQYPGWEDDLILCGCVVRIYSGGCHAPAVSSNKQTYIVVWSPIIV